MDKHENEGEQSEVEVYLFTEEEFNDRDSEEVSSEEITVDFGNAADSVLDDIKSDSLYGLGDSSVDVELDPAELPSDAVINADDVARSLEESGDISVGAELDEMSESIDIAEEQPVAYVEVDEQIDADRAARSRRRLRNVLVFFIIILVALAAVIGLFIWRDSTPPDFKQSDSDALQTSAAGTNTTEFQAIEANSIPNLVSYFGMTPEEAAAASDDRISLGAETTPVSDAALPGVTSTRNGWLVGGAGETLASITFGLSAEGTISYLFTSFDLDAFGVADAKFDELADSEVVAASILVGIGLDKAVVDQANLTITENPEAVTSRDTSGLEVAEFSGVTNIEGAPSTWKVIETYDHTAGVSLGDNSVIRTLSVDLR